MFQVLVLTILGVLQIAAFATPCEKRVRAVIDLGSGSTKLNVAEVEICKERARLVRVLEDGISRPLELEAGKRKGRIPGTVQGEAIAILSELRDAALRTARKAGYSELELSVVATHAFRTARNQDEFKKRIEAAGFPVRALSQKDEALAGLRAVQSQGLPPGCDPNSLLVWDIGGGSMQLVRSAGSTGAAPIIEGFNLGAEAFKLALMEKFKPAKSKCKFNKPTPNPIGDARSEDVRTFARETSQRLLRTPLRSTLKASCVVGIGGVHSKAVSAQLQKSWKKIKECVCKDSVRACKMSTRLYQKVQIECLARHLSGKSDCDSEIRGPYSTTAVTNLYFVLGWMDRLGIERVHTRSLNMGHYLVLDREHLKFNRFTVAKNAKK